MIFLAYAALFGIPALAAYFISAYRASPSAVSGAIVAGWLTMPLIVLNFPGVPSLDKASLLGFATLLSTWLVKSPRIRVSWFDLPIIVLCLVPIASSIGNGLGVYDGVSTAVRYVLMWGAPYAVGRMVIVDRAALTVLGRTLLFGVVAYAPLCLIESRLAPQLHEWVYGVFGRANWEQVDFFGPLRWKPTAFLQSAIELTPLMGVGFLFAWWMSRQGGMATAGGYSMKTLGWIALTATVLGKSLGGFALTMGSALVLWLGSALRTRAFLIALLVVPPVYIVTRTTGMWTGRGVAAFVREHVSARRAESFETRLMNEDVLLARALERPLLGWGGWGDNRAHGADGRDLSLTDGLWIILFGVNGGLCLLAWLATLQLPAWLVVLRSKTSWNDPSVAVLQFGAIALALHCVDCLPNSMPGAIYYLIAGGLGSVMQHEARRSRRLA
jgi:hypothetical protein